MKNLLRCILIPIACLCVAACSSSTGELSTTEGSTAAASTSTNLSAGESVTSTLVPADEVISAVTGEQITLSTPALLTGQDAVAQFSTTLASIGSKVNKVLGTVSNVAQQLNTGFQTIAPTAATLLTMLHNQGDASVLSSDAATANVENAAIQALSANMQTAITTSTAVGATPAQQQAAISQAISPAAIASIIAPIQAAAGE